jgi:hypothetical protein
MPNVALFNAKRQSAARAGLHQPRIKDQQLYMDVLDEVNSREQGIHAQHRSTAIPETLNWHAACSAHHW